MSVTPVSAGEKNNESLGLRLQIYILDIVDFNFRIF